MLENYAFLEFDLFFKPTERKARVWTNLEPIAGSLETNLYEDNASSMGKELVLLA